MSYGPGTETIRFRRPTAGPNAVAEKQKKVQEDDIRDVDRFGGKHAPLPAWKKRHRGLLQDQVGRQNSGPFIPSFSLAVRLLLLVRVSAAMYSNIQDCDEVFNFFEPLHYFTFNNGFQTWELSPEHAIRSWAYILLHWPLAHLAPFALKIQKRAAFFVLRISLGIICSVCEASFYRAVADHINERVGRYCLMMLLGSCGMWNAGGSFLPSTFTMYTTMLAFTFALPLASNNPFGITRSWRAIFFFCLGPILGWPFVGLMALPFIFEQCALRAGDVAKKEEMGGLLADRTRRLVGAGILSVVLISIPIVAIDSWAYGRLVFPNLNIVLYNVFSRSSATGPDIYGTEPATFYLANLFLNFNYLLPLALLSLPALAVTYKFDFRRLGTSQQAVKEGESSPYTLLVLRLAPFYLWLTTMSLQAHKEERFMYPLYPLLCMNAAVSIFLIKGWAETIYVKVTASPYNAGRSRIFSNISLGLLLPSLLLSASRIYALGHFYHSPFDVAYHFQYTEIPQLLVESGYKPIPPPEKHAKRHAELGYSDEWDFSVLHDFDPKVKLCYGKEWFRFPGSYLIPEGIEVGWVKSDFDGMMPIQWDKSFPSKELWRREQTRVVHPGRFNDRNEENTEAYIDVSECTYLIDSTLPSQRPTELQPDYAADSENWIKLFCEPFLDAASTPWWARIFYLPGSKVEDARVWGEYCLLRNRNA